jgi:hypothetical protein
MPFSNRLQQTVWLPDKVRPTQERHLLDDSSSGTGRRSGANVWGEEEKFVNRDQNLSRFARLFQSEWLER